MNQNLFPDVAHESNVLNISFVAHESNVLKVSIVAHGTLTNNTTRQQSLLGSLSAFPVWDILRHAAHACDACDSGRWDRSLVPGI